MEKKTSLIRVSDLWHWDGVIDRLPYAVLGGGLVAAKYGLDGFLATAVFHHAWSWYYYITPAQAVDLLAITQADRNFFAAMLALSLPFIWIGIVLTMRRLRAVNLPVWLCTLFFLPVVNFIVFCMLCILPTAKTAAQKELQASNPYELPEPEYNQTAPSAVALNSADHNTSISKPAGSKVRLPASKLARAEDTLYAIALTVPVAAVLAFLGASILKTYGWGLFLGVPFGVGMVSSYLFGRKHLRSLGDCVFVAGLAITLVGVTIFFWAWEGALCLIMAGPLAYALAFMGALLGYYLQKKKNLPSREAQQILLSLLIILPLCMGADYANKGAFPTCAVNTVCLIDAPPQTVWKYIIAFPKLQEPKEWIFRAGVAYPTGATIDGHGPGAVRRCKFSTGTFVEPIQVWDEPRLLQFGVWSQAEPMKEMSFGRNLQPAHLNGYLNIHKGQFRLNPLMKNGRVCTELVGTTWYDNRMWPASYWRFYADNIMHSIHSRVLAHIKSLSEADAKLGN